MNEAELACAIQDAEYLERCFKSTSTPSSLSVYGRPSAMTSNPITIAGETITDADWPEGCEYFTRHEQNHSRRFSLENWYDIDGEEIRVPAEDMDDYVYTSLIAAVARCHFLDKAAECVCMREVGRSINGTIYLETVPEEQEKHARYLLSAEKWARIGRAK